MVTVITCIVLLYTLCYLDKELTDKYTTNPDLLIDMLIDRWLVPLRYNFVDIHQYRLF